MKTIASALSTSASSRSRPDTSLSADPRLRALRPLRLGFVNSSKVLMEFPEAQEVNKLDGVSRQWQSAGTARQGQTKYEDFQKKNPSSRRTKSNFAVGN